MCLWYDCFTQLSLISVLHGSCSFISFLNLYYLLSFYINERYICSSHIMIGKRLNPLRKRVDSVNYDLDQLLLGTICFSCLIFLFPTIFIYYSLFFAVSFYGTDASGECSGCRVWSWRILRWFLRIIFLFFPCQCELRIQSASQVFL